jgi:diguanylate cyclase (GGDEF)-like protein
MSRENFLAQLTIAKARADRDLSGIVLCLVDVDQLRNINDRHGQAAGDEVLRQTASRATGVLALSQWRALEGLLARFDGDGFIVLLEGARLHEGERLAEELRRRVACAPYVHGLRVTVSIAVTAYRGGESTDALLARTERTLHLAKESGRDRVEIARTPETRHARAALTSIAAGARRPA